MEGALPAVRTLPGMRRWAYLLALSVAIGIGLAVMYWSLTSIGFEDVDAYWNAGLRLRDGQQLYPAALDTPTSMYYGAAYRYAPWFALVWVPLTLLPKVVAMMLWQGSLAIAAGWIVWQVTRAGMLGLGLLAIMGPLLVQGVVIGNVQPLLIALLLTGHPLAVGVAASLKGTPLLFAAVYVGRREWRKLAIAVGSTVALVAPLLLYDLSRYPGSAGMEPLPLPLLALAGLAFTALAVRFANTRYAWLLAAIAVMVSLPRPNPYNMTFLLVGLRRDAGTPAPHRYVAEPARTVAAVEADAP